MRSLYPIFASVLIVFYFLLPLSSSQAICSLASTNACVDDLDYLHCRLQQEIKALEKLGGEEAEVDASQPLFSDAGRQKCELFVKQGFCVSQPTEMTGYCCKTSVRFCSDGSMLEPPPIADEEILMDDVDDADEPPVVKIGVETTPIRALVTPTTTTTTTLATTTTAITQQEPSSIVVVPSPSPINPHQPSPQSLCQFIDAAAAAASVAAESLKSFSFLFESLAPVHQLAAAAADEEELLPSEQEEKEVVELPPTETPDLTLQNSDSDPTSQNSDSDNNNSEDSAENRNRRGSKMLSKQQQRRKAAAEGEIVIFDPPVEWNAAPVLFGPNSRIKAPKRSARQKKMDRKIRQLQEEEIEDSAEMDAGADEEEDEAAEDSDEDEVDLGILGMMGPDSSDLIASLLPKLHLKELNYTRVESTDIIGYGKDIAKILSNCNGCLLPVVEIVMDGAFQDEIPADATLAEQRRITKKNSEALIQMTAADFSNRGVKALERFIAEMQTEREVWLLQRQQAPAAAEDLTMEGFMQHSLNALKRVLKEDDLGGLMANLLSVIGVVTKNMQDETKYQEFKASGEKIYSEVFGCSRDINSATSEMNSVDKPSENGRRLMVRREGTSQQDNLVQGQQQAVVAVAGKGKSTMQQQLCNSKGRNAAAAEAEAYGQGSTINKRQLQGESGAEQETDASNEVAEGDFLEGQPCLDRPVEFIASLQRLYSGLSCNDLISSISCAPERFLLPLETVVEACKLTWMQRCVEATNGTEAAAASSSSRLDGLNNTAVAELLRSGQCVNREQEGVVEQPESTTTTTTTSTSTSGGALRTTTSTTTTTTVTVPDNDQNKDSSASSPSLFVVFVSVALSAIVSYCQ